MDKESKIAFRKKVGKLVEKFRLEKGFTQRILGEKLGYEGNSAIQVVARFESGRAGIPKAKIGQLIEILGITNKDFGLDTTKSLKSFISVGGFLGSPAIPFGNAIVDFMNASEAEVFKQAISDEDDLEENSHDEFVDFSNLIRLMALYRVQQKSTRFSLIKLLETVDQLCAGDDQKFADILTVLEINPQQAYLEIEKKLIEVLSKANSIKK
ncbi:MAG: helix-turn-helix transcriptional regulator [SAR324 cluster bacterium]|nr:helix-turn-helix transcriptional regulator [SAR324 cluster bacterium]